jgi:hypothetical protein
LPRTSKLLEEKANMTFDHTHQVLDEKARIF